MAFTIYHNPKCGTSRNVLAALREAGHEPQVIEYLKTPPSRETLESLIARAGEGARGLLRAKEPLVKELGLDGADVTDAAIIDAMMAHPVLINRPIVVTDSVVKLCRPSETVQELL
ncbi:MAG: arsenate reductase [Blastomonas sp. CACIA14H2]|jgi:arsenate reductase (glutaredoxin)|uniref:arsenate reductase (glutaredoxin) n=1 Tax=unclassified Blastomonas TaxID=2626550 RepID=UPI0003D0264A|nr:arsenate reductase (glutaredoxin) [Blastomonas sp. UPD001]ESZ87049.1 MAG: arsenate reductase [Blastomonas sp. CACIA14H2]MBL0965468.1 arsenate reductase (glutaredoxin) [Blastomonas sp.]